mmetsp:Transcript_55278/g.125665  ORF Transcript_55278/g.125665 Transcript_55278/m.125665 type:complete len:128 (-) Transcript_55278:407-790(-)
MEAAQRASAELEGVTADRDEVLRDLEKTEHECEAAREELENETQAFRAELEGYEARGAELEEALEEGQRMARKAAARHQRELEVRNEIHAAALPALAARTSACEKRAEAAVVPRRQAAVPKNYASGR